MLFLEKKNRKFEKENKNLFAINRIKEELVFNRPIYIEIAILDFSKLLLYDFHYNNMLKI